MMRRAEAARVELQQTVRRMADKEIARLQGIIDTRKKKSQEKKRKEFSRLKQQMEEDLRRRAGEKQAEKDEEAKLMARITREEDAMTEEEMKLEQQAREELVQYYTELGEEAAHRERKALWRVQRARLSMQREEFLERDALGWGRELNELQKTIDRRRHVVGDTEQIVTTDPANTSPDVVDYPVTSPGTDLPHWVQKHGGGDAELPVEVSGEEQVTLPAWAARELPSDIEEEDKKEASEDGTDILGPGVQLPNWVLREAQDDDEEGPRIIDDSGEQEVINESDNVCASDGSGNVFSRGQTETKDIVGAKPENWRNSKSERQLKAVLIGGSPLPKTYIKTNLAYHHSVETEESEARPNTQLVQGKHITAESSPTVMDKPNIKLLPGMSASTQSKEAEVRAHVKSSGSMSATKESEPEDLNPKTHVRVVEGTNVNQQTTKEQRMCPRRAKAETQENVSSESVPKVWVIKKPSMFGHVSELSGSEYVLTVPKLKRQVFQHANSESEFKDFGIKPRIRISKTMYATKQSSDLESVKGHGSRKPQVKKVEGRGISLESERVDENEIARKRFLARNSHGHASDSTVQRLLYGGDMRTSLWATPDIEEDEPGENIIFALMIKC